MLKNPWVQSVAKDDVSLRLICLPYAGGGASIYRLWQEYMPDDVQVCRIQLPGRENRINENAIDSMEILVESLAEQILPLLDRPFALFGHSMGAMITYELARYLIIHKKYTPKHIWISACRSPHVLNTKPIHDLSSKEFINALIQRGGTHEDLINNREFMEMIEPTLRADLKLIEQWHHCDMFTVDCPITVFAATDDSLISSKILKQWDKYTSNTFDFKEFNGGHFFLNDTSHNIASIVANTLKNY